jgi:hypothetical protein
MRNEEMPRLTHKLTALSLILLSLACVCLAALVPVSRNASARTQNMRNMNTSAAAKDEPKVSVFGHAVYDDTSRPVRRARIILQSFDGRRTEFSALTDARGEFRIVGVTPGSYFAFAIVPGVLSPVSFISLSALQQSAPDFSNAVGFFDTVDVDGKEDRQLTVHARRGATLAGKVAYSDGDPAVNVPVSVMRRDGGRLTKYMVGVSISALAGQVTDDRGMFRIAGLPPGEYVIGVSEAAVHGNESRSPREDFAGLYGLGIQQLLMTFYPSAVEAKDATVIKVEAGDERADVDITIPERGLHTVEGLVRGGLDKRPVTDARLNIIRKNDDSGADANASAGRTTTDEQGRWQFKEIPDGQYTIAVTPPERYDSPAGYPNGNVSVMNANVTITNANVTVTSMNMNGSAYSTSRRKKSYAPAHRDVRVEGGDVSEVTVELGAGGHVSGTMIFEGEKQPEYGYVQMTRVPDGSDASDLEGSNSARAYNGEFSIEGLPAGKYFLQPSTYDGDGEAKVYAKSITWNGKDLTRTPLEVGEGAVVAGVQIVFARNPSTLTVSVTSGDGKKPAFNTRVFLVPSDAGAGWSPYAQQLLCSTDDSGSCSIKAAPGDYRVVALTRKDAPTSLEAEVTRRAATAPGVSLRAGETKEFELSLPGGN